ncbi:hypothetical protein T459_07933 [Capsicum annuum]|uniref:CCHC-type domain-containing protein n=1 Tax=Capsicum annuum TaxID=4072 RepID=A0A1U8G595_CAPAN|nr:uncharacterized protein LOC107864619 [Capsicum annuum]PHT85827.1 hypothetical protein T459_07933 [Capsicum annuum]
MTNFNDNDIDLGLALGCTTRNDQTKPKDDTGAGVNASSMVDMAFAASDPLAELVWSPHKGLSLKCAEGGLAEKRPFLLWNVGPSSLVAAPSQSDRFKGICDENAVYEKIFDPQERFQTTNEMVSMSGNEIGCSSKVKIMNTADGTGMVDANQDEENLKNTGKGFCITQDINQTVESCENHAGQGDFGTERFMLHGASSKVDMETTGLLAGKINQEISTSDNCREGDASGGSQTLIPTVKDTEAPVCLLPNSPIEMEADNALESTSPPALHKLECTAENDVHLPGINKTCDQNEEQLVRDSSLPFQTSPTHSRSSSYRRKGKGKAVSVGNVSSKMSNDEEDSHESVESCNSTGLAPKCKRRWHFEQQFFVGSKRIRTDMHGDPATESTVARNSSFVTWISNMIKGFSKSNLEESPTLALTFTPNNEENHGKETNRQEIVMFEKDHDSSSRLMGFQTVFQSLYCPTSKVPETEIPKEDHSMGKSNKLPSADKILIDVPPISCHPGDDMLDAHMPISNDKFDQSTVARKEVPLMQTQIMPAAVASSDIACSKAKDGLSPSDSVSRLRTSEDKNTSHSSEYDISNRNQSLRSLWITRFSNKTPGAVLNIDDNSKPTTHEILACSTECRRPNHQAQTSVECRIEQASFDAKETSSSSKEIHDNNYERSVNNLHPIISSAKFKKSEALASLFARRLDALKLIGPSSTRSEYSYTRTTCFFCGKSGHDLRDCSEVTQSELEVLIRSIGSYDSAEEPSCLCIRCFQLDHWAISCPTSSSNRSQQLEHKISLVNQNRNDNLRLFSESECLPSLLEIKQGHPIELRDKSSFDLMDNKKKFWFAPASGSNQVQKQITSDLTKNNLKENMNLVCKEIADVPRGMFDVIRGLRLSRVDILKWMNSNTSLSHLDGFFLRLRLGKCEAALGGTGYYVACITGLNGEKLERDSNNGIYVNVCGVKCFVGSQYVSNQDFLEDELTIWWRKTLESGGNVPTREDLRLKLDERMKLGF